MLFNTHQVTDIGEVGASFDGPRALQARRVSAMVYLIATGLPVVSVQRHSLPWTADGDASSMPAHVRRGDGDLGPVRVMTTHLAYHSAKQLLAQAGALRNLRVGCFASRW